MAKNKSNELNAADQNQLLPAENRELVISGEEVYLPDSGRIKPGSTEFSEIINEVLPDYTASLSEEAMRRPRGYSIPAILLILFLLGGIVFSIYLFRPRVFLQSTDLYVPEPENNRYTGTNPFAYTKARDFIDKKKYSAAKAVLAPIVDELLKNGGDQSKNTMIFYSYFDLFKYLGWDDNAKKQLEKLKKIDPHEYRWRLFEILSCPVLCQQNLLPDEPNLDYPHRSVYDTMKKIDDLRREMQKDQEVVKLLDLCKCYLGWQDWRLYHFERKDIIGAAPREEAWGIASRYKKDKSFIEIRKNLAKRLYADSPKYKGSFIAFGEEYWFWFGSDDLSNLLNKISKEAEE